MFQLGGFTRIGIVLSIVWSLIVLTYAGVEYYQMSAEREEMLSNPLPENSRFVMEPATDAIFFEWLPVDLLAKGPASKVRDFHFLRARLSLTWIGPIVTSWIIVYIIIITLRWIRAGFDGSK